MIVTPRHFMTSLIIIIIIIITIIIITFGDFINILSILS